eukprot:gene4431-3230_t
MQLYPYPEKENDLYYYLMGIKKKNNILSNGKIIINNTPKETNIKPFSDTAFTRNYTREKSLGTFGVIGFRPSTVLFSVNVLIPGQ